MHQGVIIVAGGKGKRMQSTVPKQFLHIHDKPVIVRTVEKFFAFNPDLPVVLVLPQTHWEYWFDTCAEHFTIEQNKKISLARGAETRTLSVWHGLQIYRLMHFNAYGNAPCVLGIHDAVRPMVESDHIRALFEGAESKKAVVSAVKVKNSIRKIRENGSVGVDRSEYYEVHTPQVFDFELLWRSYQHRLGDDFSDDASLFEAHWKDKYPVHILEGSYQNLKITTPDDLFFAQKYLTP